MNTDFQFRQFKVSHSRSTMKVGTDAILLGSWSAMKASDTILDIGTGSGVIALMMAQRCMDCSIHAIDIDLDSINEAKHNFKNSPWQTRLFAHHSSLQDFAVNCDTGFDHLVSNPPFFSGDKKSVYPSRTKSRHTVYLDHIAFFNHCAELGNSNCRVSVIIPTLISDYFFSVAADFGFYPCRILKVIPKPESASNRLLIEFSRARLVLQTRELLIYGYDGNYTDDYQKLTSEYYL